MNNGNFVPTPREHIPELTSALFQYQELIALCNRANQREVVNSPYCALPAGLHASVIHLDSPLEKQEIYSLCVKMLNAFINNNEGQAHFIRKTLYQWRNRLQLNAPCLMNEALVTVTHATHLYCLSPHVVWVLMSGNPSQPLSMVPEHVYDNTVRWLHNILVNFLRSNERKLNVRISDRRLTLTHLNDPNNREALNALITVLKTLKEEGNADDLIIEFGKKHRCYFSMVELDN